MPKYVAGGISYSQDDISYNGRKRQWQQTAYFATFVLQAQAMGKYIVISTTVDLVRIAPESVVYISSDGNYSTLIQADGLNRILTVQLGQLEALIAKQLGTEGNVFIRIGKSLIINRNYIYYINIPKQQLVLSDARTVSHQVTASKEALRQLKELVEKEEQ